MYRKNIGKYCITFLFLSLSVGLLTGCGATLPDLKSEDMELVTDYAVEKLLEHDTNTPSRLVAEEDLLAKEAKDLAKKQKQEEREKRRQELEKQVEEEREKLENENSQDPAQSAPQTPSYSTDLRELNDILGWPSEVYLQYVGEEVTNVYPAQTTGGIDGVNSTAGNSLCVLYFDIFNTSDEAKTVFVDGRTTYFQIQVNGGGKLNSMLTILPDDLNSYAGTIEPIGGEVPRVVLIRDYPQDTLSQIDSIVVVAKHGSDSVSVRVK